MIQSDWNLPILESRATGIRSWMEVLPEWDSESQKLRVKNWILIFISLPAIFGFLALKIRF